jgi:hypothetical protein
LDLAEINLFGKLNPVHRHGDFEHPRPSWTGAWQHESVFLYAPATEE